MLLLFIVLISSQGDGAYHGGMATAKGSMNVSKRQHPACTGPPPVPRDYLMYGVPLRLSSSPLLTSLNCTCSCDTYYGLCMTFSTCAYVAAAKPKVQGQIWQQVDKYGGRGSYMTAAKTLPSTVVHCQVSKRMILRARRVRVELKRNTVPR